MRGYAVNPAPPPSRAANFYFYGHAFDPSLPSINPESCRPFLESHCQMDGIRGRRKSEGRLGEQAERKQDDPLWRTEKPQPNERGKTVGKTLEIRLRKGEAMGSALGMKV